MGMTAGKCETDSYSCINMTPLIDVMLVLLIIFIITLPIQTHAVKIDNPNKGSAMPPERTDVVELAIDVDGAVSWNGTPVDHATLLVYVREAAHRSVQPAVHLLVDRSSRYEPVAQVLADLQRLGLKKIGFVNSGL